MRCGSLVTAKGSVVVPLTKVAFHITLLDFCAQVTIKQLFQNNESAPIEATFEFPIDENVAVTKFRAKIDGKVIECKMKEKEAAKNAYEDALASGNGAYLAEQTKKDAFQVSVGALPPGKAALIEMTYVAEATISDKSAILFTIPGSQGVKLGSSSSFLGSSEEKEFDAPFTIKAAVAMGSKIKSVRSLNHPVSFELGSDNQVGLTFTSAEVPADGKDFVLEALLAEPNNPNARIQLGPDGTPVAMLSFFPRLSASLIKSEFLFVVDRSGSMSGTPIENVKKTLQLFLRSLNEGTSFNILSFGSSFSNLFPSSRDYDEDSLQAASSHVQSINADMGGTNLSAPLRSIKQLPVRAGFSRQVFILTDGQVDDNAACFELVRDLVATTRVFTFGIGSGVDRALVFGLAKAGEGSCELIQDSNMMSQKVMRQLSKASQPALTSVSLDWGSVEATQAPFILPPLFNGSRMIAYGFLKPGAKGMVTLRGTFSDHPFAQQVFVDSSMAVPGDQVTKLAAKSAIRDLEEGRSSRGKMAEDVKKRETITLSLKYGVLSQYTAFIGIEKRSGDSATSESLVRREISQEPQNKSLSQPQSQQQVADLFAAPTTTAGPPMMDCLFAAPVPASRASAGSGLFGSAAPPSPGRASAGSGLFGSAAPPSAGFGGASFSFGKASPVPASSAPAPPPCVMPGMPPPMGGMGMPCMAPMAPMKSMSMMPAMQPMGMPVMHPMPSNRPMAPSMCSADPFSSSCSCSYPAPQPTRRIEAMDIIILQKANGSWPMSVLSLLEMDYQLVTKSLPAESVGMGCAVLIWTAFITVAYLEKKFPLQKDEWEMVASKAIKWALAEAERSFKEVGSITQCPSGHPISPVPIDILKRENAGYSAGYICDKCGKTVSSEPSIHCSKCQYDICPSCAAIKTPVMARNVQWEALAREFMRNR